MHRLSHSARKSIEWSHLWTWRRKNQREKSRNSYHLRECRSASLRTDFNQSKQHLRCCQPYQSCKSFMPISERFAFQKIKSERDHVYGGSNFIIFQQENASSVFNTALHCTLNCNAVPCLTLYPAGSCQAPVRNLNRNSLFTVKM